MSKIAVNEITDEVGTGAPAFPNGMSVTGAALTDPEITGGIYLGGTGSANYLDDYEEGIYTPTLLNAELELTRIAYGNYLKIGSLVYIEFNLKMRRDTSSTSAVQFGGLPFTPKRAAKGHFIFFEPTGWAYQVISGFVSGTTITLYRPSSSTDMASGTVNNNFGTTFKVNDVSDTTNTALQELGFNAVYQTDS